MALHVVFAAEGKGPPYLIGEDGSDLVRVFDPQRRSISEPPVHVGSVLGHMPYTSFEDYGGSPEEEAAILESARAALQSAGS